MKSTQEPDRTVRAGGTLLAALLIPGFALSCSVIAANAVNWSAIGFISEHLQFDDNLQVTTPSRGDVFGATTSFSLALNGSTPRAELNLEGGGTVAEYTGPGETRGLDSFDQNVKGSLELRQERSSVTLTASLARADSLYTSAEEAAFGEFDDLVVTSGRTDRLSYAYGATVTAELDRANQLRASVNHSVIDFARSVTSLVSTENTVVSVAWTNNVTDTTDFDLNSSVRFFKSDNTSRTRSRNSTVTGRLTTEFNERLTVYSEAGISIIATAQTIAPAGRRETTTVGAVFDFGLTWHLDALTTFTGAISRSVSPSSLGSLQERTGLNLGLVHLINSSSQIALSGIYATQTAAGGSGAAGTTFASFAATYSKQLSRYWNFSLGYRLRINDSLGGTGVSNNVFATLSRELVLLP